MNLLIFFVILMISFIVVRIGAIAFELTGLEWSLAKFQALSCFTGTGFTTRESELITSNTQRRRVASVLMVLGNAGLVSLIATFANSLRADVLESKIPFIPLGLPSRLVPLMNLTIIIIFMYIGYKIFTRTNFSRKFTNMLRARIINKDIIKRVSFEELVIATGGYGVSSINICENSPVLNKTLRDSDLRKWDITVLSIERNNETIPNPSADTQILLNDILICFGKLENIRAKIYDVTEELKI
ncbi:MAG: TrkA C-terminal domain-containing protein [Candidatus Saelkia tenebricola]|nr:TrkA C-terminal domain-containing protein [Candidatus Saelkia tenebricola]